VWISGLVAWFVNSPRRFLGATGCRPVVTRNE
jgi:hypothetical protein